MADPITGEAAQAAVADAVQQLLGTGVAAVTVARDTAGPPLMAYLTHFPRLSVVLAGAHTMTLARGGDVAAVGVPAGHAVYVPARCWNLPDWAEPVRDLTFLFGPRHVGVSLTDHPGGGPDVAPRTVKTSVPRRPRGVLHHLLDALAAAEADADVVRPIVTAVVHAAHGLLTEPAAREPARARRAYESIRLFVQQNAHLPITRRSVAADFGLSPNHVSRLFRRAGDDGFNRTLTLARVDRAKVLLGHYGSQYGTPLKEVARHCGFATTAYFCRTFKRVTDRTPTEYRQGLSA